MWRSRHFLLGSQAYAFRLRSVRITVPTVTRPSAPTTCFISFFFTFHIFCISYLEMFDGGNISTVGEFSFLSDARR